MGKLLFSTAPVFQFVHCRQPHHGGSIHDTVKVRCAGALRYVRHPGRDLALVMAKGLDGATTVSQLPMLLAARAGIHVFVTGGATLCHKVHPPWTVLVVCLALQQNGQGGAYGAICIVGCGRPGTAQS